MLIEMLETFVFFLQEAAKLHSCGVILCSCGQERLIRCRVPDQACQDRQDDPLAFFIHLLPDSCADCLKHVSCNL